jgi:hypothetical protein
MRALRSGEAWLPKSEAGFLPLESASISRIFFSKYCPRKLHRRRFHLQAGSYRGGRPQCQHPSRFSDPHPNFFVALRAHNFK